jgi:hypothetical protein
MSLRSCRVIVQDMEGVTHSVEVTAGTLYEAVAQGLAAVEESDWVASIAQGLNVVKVSVADVRVEHEVKMIEFKRWLERPGGSPREVGSRKRVREILGSRRVV